MSGTVVSFVVLAFDGGDALEPCLGSVLAQDEGPIECLLVDNASRDQSVERAVGRFPEVHVIRNDQNLGFAGGMNVGIRASSGDVVVCVNQDVLLAPHFARTVRRVLSEDLRVGAVGGVVRRLDQGGRSETFDGGGYMLRRRLAVGPIGPMRERSVDVFGVAGCCPAFRRAMLEDIRLAEGEYFDASYFLYFEDLDLFFRAQLRAWRVVYVGDLLAWHRRSMSSGGGPRFFHKPLWIQRLHLRNRYFTLIKDCPASILWRILPLFLVSEVLVWPFLLLRSPRSLIAVVRAWGDVLLAMGELSRKRWAIQSRRTARGSDLRRFLRGV